MAQQNTPDTVEILSIGRIAHPHYGDETCLDVLFMLPVATYGESLYRARIWDAGDGVFYFEHYATEGGRKFDALYYRALPSGYDWADWAAQMARDTATQRETVRVEHVAVSGQGEQRQEVELALVHDGEVRMLGATVVWCQGGHAGDVERCEVTGARWLTAPVGAISVAEWSALGLELAVRYFADELGDEE